MSETTNKSLHRLIEGSALVFLGTVVGLLVGFLIKVMFARYTTQNDYGIFSLAFTVVSIFTTISALGLREGTSRYIACFRGRDEIDKVQTTVFSSIIIALFTSLLVTGISTITSEITSQTLFNTPEISPILKILSVTIPFVVLTNIFVAIFRGFGRVDINIYFNNILRNVSYLIFLVAVILFGFSFLEMVYAYVVSTLVTCVTLVVYFFKKPPLKIKWSKIHDNHITKKLVVFSIPLLAVNILLTVMAWTDTVMLGYFKTPEVVASYNVVHPLASLLSVVISSISFLYVPLISQLYGKKQIKEMGTINASSTKWCFILTLPIFYIMFVFPEITLDLFFGSRYTEASVTLQILTVGFLLDSLFGFNYYTLLSSGKSKFLMNCSLISAFLNIILNALLIPPYGMVGAAIASAASFAAIEIYMTTTLYKIFRIHAFTKSYIKVIIISTLLISLFYFGKCLFEDSLWTLILTLVFFIVIYTLSILFSKSLDKDDIIMLKTMEQRIPINFTYIEAIFKKWYN